MDPAVAALFGAAIGAIAALGGQMLAHRFAVSRDQDQQLRGLVDEGVAAVRDGLMLSDSIIATPDPIGRKQAIAELYKALRLVIAAQAKVDTRLPSGHALALAYDRASERFIEFAESLINSGAPEGWDPEPFRVAYTAATAEFDRFRSTARALIALRRSG